MARQQRLPGTTRDGEQKPIPDIENAAEVYEKSVTKLVISRAKVVENKAALIKLMRDNKVESYKTEDGRTFTIVPGKEKIAISDKEQHPDEDDEEGEE